MGSFRFCNPSFRSSRAAPGLLAFIPRMAGVAILVISCYNYLSLLKNLSNQGFPGDQRDVDSFSSDAGSTTLGCSRHHLQNRSPNASPTGGKRNPQQHFTNFARADATPCLLLAHRVRRERRACTMTALPGGGEPEYRVLAFQKCQVELLLWPANPPADAEGIPRHWLRKQNFLLLLP
jgi:hypothetical protein